MLGKLLRHEWKSVWKIPTVLICLLLVLSVMAGTTFMTPVWESDIRGLDVLVMILWLLFYFGIIGVSLGITLYLAIHFYRSMFTDEGYLTHTLPVTSHQLLISKILPIMAWLLITILAVFLGMGIFGSMAVAALSSENFNFARLYKEAIEVISDKEIWGSWGFSGFISSVAMLGVAGIVNGAMVIVGAISIGQLVNKHKVLGSIGAYFAINTVVQIFTGVILLPMLLSDMKTPESVFALLTPAYFILAVIAVLVSVVLYFLSEYLIRRRLNLD